MKRVLVVFAGAEKGATAIEYALIASLIALVIVAGVTNVGLVVSDAFDAVAAGFAGA
jgi:pilus assembly protein Flp/PilA